MNRTRFCLASCCCTAIFIVSASAATARAADDVQADIKRLQEMAVMFNPSLFPTMANEAAEVCKQIAPAKEERKRIEQKYTDPKQAKQIKGVLGHFDQVVARFEETAGDYSAPAKIDADIDEALKMGDEAVQNRRYLYFTPKGGVAQRLRFADERLTVLAALKPDDPETKAERDKLAAAREKVKAMQATLLDGIVQSNSPPEERYGGADKAQLIELVKKKWAESGVASPVMKVGINSQNWQRNTRWEWNKSNAWEKVDKSFIQGYVIVKQDDKTAVIHYVNLVKDHLANDQITTHFFEDPNAEPDVSRKLAVAKVK